MNGREEKIIAAPVWPPAGGTGGCRTDGTATPAAPEEIRSAVRSKYAEVAVSAAGKFSYPTGREGAAALGYDPAVLERAHARFFESSCGVGNPFSLGAITAGESVLDIGCGGGLDLFVAAALAGPGGRVAGIDLTEDMVRRAQENLAQTGVKNVEVRKVDGDFIPYGDHSFDVVISNGVINLSPDKEALFREIHRVLKPGGRLQFADVVLDGELPASLAGSAEAWSQWIGGAVPVGDQVKLLTNAGFRDVAWTGMTGFRTSPYTVGALFRARKAEKG